MIALALVSALAAAPADVVKEIDVRASPSDVWKAWTTVDGAKTFFAPDARIVAEAGGAYELYFDPAQPSGKRGSEGCTVTAIEPLKKLSFSWNFPPALASLRDAKATTTVTVELLPQGKTTRVRLTQTGWKDEPAWHEGRAYFERAWRIVLARLAHRFRRKPLDWNNPWAPQPISVFRFLDGTFVSADGPELESWSYSDSGVLGAARANENGKPIFYELATIEPDDGEWVLLLRMFKNGLATHPKTEKEAARLVLDTVEKDHAVFVSESSEPVRIEYTRSGDALTVSVKTAAHEETHVFKRRP